MAQMNHYACIEVAIRDTEPGRISIDKTGKLVVDKRLGAEDRRRRDRGLEAVRKIFESTGALEVIPGALPFSLHLMGGCGIGTSGASSVVDPELRLHGYPNIFVADSSVFPRAPGINPSLTVMAIALMGAASILKEKRHVLKAS
jgi:choline dehydrogenase-like flavoprotein